MKILYVSAHINRKDKSGITVGTNSNFNALKNAIGNHNIEKLYIENAYSNRLNKIMNLLFFKNYGGISAKIEKRIMSQIEIFKYDYVYIDVSYWGNLIKLLYKKQIKTIAFFQDVEVNRLSSIFNIEIKQYKILSAVNTLIKMYIARLNESKTIHYANIIIGLSKRDSNEAKKIYKREFDYIIPAFMSDDFNEKTNQKYTNKQRKLLFVGVASYQPNISGLNRFIKKVMPYVNATLSIVGYGMEKYKNEFESISNNVFVVGTVDDISIQYYNSDIVVAPIYSGGGMKIKVLEALMYGKTILGTSEAFEGFDLNYDLVGGLCNTDEEFIEKINYIEVSKTNVYSRNSFIELYSTKSVTEKYKDILKLNNS